MATNNPPPITLSILTWRAPITLQRTLETLAPILPLFEQHLVVCQESDPEEMDIARRAKFDVIKTHENIGIQNGLKLAVEAASHELVLVLVLENDAEYLGGRQGAAVLEETFLQMQKYQIDHIQLGRLDRSVPRRYVRFWGTQFPPKRQITGYVRYKMANSLKRGALSLPQIAAAKSFPGYLKITNSLWQTTPQYVKWNNRSFLTRKNFFLGNLVPFAESHPTSRLINGHADLEHPINCYRNRYWWRSQSFSIGVSVPGLFGHQRHDRTLEDDKSLQQNTSTPNP